VTPVVLALPGNEALADDLAHRLAIERGTAIVRRFPDGETYVRIDSDVGGRSLVLASTLDRPDDKTLPLLLLAATARDLGAARVGLLAPYLAYLRQDRRFLAGEGVTSTYFARLLSGALDWLVTVDPHLHRVGNLADLYAIPVVVQHAAPLIATWIAAHVRDPVLIGPDAESAQWVAGVAVAAGAPHVVLEKTRRGDRTVEVSAAALGAWQGRTPVLIDDIISTGATMRATLAHLRARPVPAPLCVGVHAVFADDAYQALAAGAARVVTCNTIPHPSNAIDVGGLLADGVRKALDG
jgi:ribose-phosphate pyrophosphokinase